MWIGGIKVPKLINWLQGKIYDSSPDFVANTYRTSEDALGRPNGKKTKPGWNILLSVPLRLPIDERDKR